MDFYLKTNKIILLFYSGFITSKFKWREIEKEIKITDINNRRVENKKTALGY